MAFQSLSDMVKNYESGGSYTIRNPSPGSTASGAYQFTNTTWRAYAGPTLSAQYPTAADAPPAVQDAIFNKAVQTNGLNDWTCPGCNPKLTQYLADNPDQRNLPTFGPGGPTDGPITNVNNVPTTDPSSNQPAPAYTPMGDSTGLGPVPVDLAASQAIAGQEAAAATAASMVTPGPVGFLEGTSIAIGGWLTSAEQSITGLGSGVTTAIEGMAGKITTSIESSVGDWMNKSLSYASSVISNWFKRWGMVILALILILIALWRLVTPDKKTVIALTRTAAEAGAA